MKSQMIMAMTALALSTGLFSQTSAIADDTVTVSPKEKQAEATMLKACKKEFPDQVQNRGVDEIDQWAEARESANDSAFKKSQCFAKHEKWEKIAQKNEWAVSTDPNHPTRLPASQK